MPIFKKICFCMLPFLQSACTQVSPGEAALDKFTIAFSKEIEKEYGYKTYGIGASMPVKIESIRLCFQSSYPADIEQARKVVVPITLKFIQRMNEDENLMKYLANMPASLKNVELLIGFKEQYKGSLDSVMLIGFKNSLGYKIHNEAQTKLIDLHRETFDEAERIVFQSSK